MLLSEEFWSSGTLDTTIEERILKEEGPFEQMINMNPESMNCIYSDGRIIRKTQAFLALLAADKYGDVLGEILNDMSPSIDSALRKSIKVRVDMNGGTL